MDENAYISFDIIILYSNRYKILLAKLYLLTITIFLPINS